MTPPPLRPNALRIDLEAAAHNVRAVRRLIGARPAPHRHDCRPARHPRLPVFLSNSTAPRMQRGR